MTGARIVVEVLMEQGVTVTFGYPGGQVIHLFEELYRCRDRIRNILPAHEQGSAHAADGYARATGKTGVVLATSGPGATNLVTGIATAFLDSVPMVAITGNVPCTMIGRDSFQEVDIVGVSMPVTKHNFIVKDVSLLAETLREAFRIAISGRPGPVLVDIPKDVQTALTEFTPEEPVRPLPLPKAPESQLREAAEMIQSAERPYIYFGGGILSGDASAELIAFAERIHAPMGCSLMGLSAVPTHHPLFLGMQGMHGHYAASVAEDEADLVIALGARFSDRATGPQKRFYRHFKVVHIDIDGAELNKNIPAALSIRGGVKNALSRLNAMLPQMHHPVWTERIAELRTEEERRTEHAQLLAESVKRKNCTDCTALCSDAGTRHTQHLTPYQIIDAVASAASEEDIIATDVGQHQMWVAQRYPLYAPRTFLTSGGLGTMGFGMGAAIGAYTALGRRVILFTGDGSFGMNLNELATAVTENVNLVILILNNGVLGMVRQIQTLFLDRHHSNTTLSRKTDLVRVAEAFGAKGRSARNLPELQQAVGEAFAQNGPFVIDCTVDCDALVLPTFPPGGTIDDIITEIKTRKRR